MLMLKYRRDFLSWYRCLSAIKIRNAASLFLSFHLSKVRKRSIHWGMPMSISIEPTTSCNLRCPECPSGLRAFTRPTGMLNQEHFQSMLNQFGKQLWSINFYFQGEPYLNKELLPMVQHAVSKQIYTATSTNAHYLTADVAKETVASGLHRLIISLDGTTQETYEQYRIGGKLSKVIEGTKQVVLAKKNARSATPYIIFQFLVVKPNEHQTQDALQLAKELGVDEVRFKTAQVYDYENGHSLIPEQEKYARYRQGKDGKWKIKNKLDNSCWRMWQGCVVTWDGGIVPCCFDKDASHQFGKLTEDSLNHIWKGEKYRAFRSGILTNRSEIEICKNCSEGSKVWA